MIEPPPADLPLESAEEAQPLPPGRGFLTLAPEGPWHRRRYAIFALVLVAAFFVYNIALWAPAHGGTDQNGYLVGGRMMAEHWSTRLDTHNPDNGQLDPFAFVGTMWVGAGMGTPQERFYPKYPIGLPALVAVLVKVGGLRWGTWMAYLISPICMTLAMVAVFFMLRMVAGSLAAMLGMIIVATSPVTLGLTNNPNSHASTLFCVTWGMYLLMRWWGHGSWWRALGAGLLLGYAVTIRYTEGLLILPLALVVLFRWRWERRFFKEAALALAGWGLPVVILVIFNLRAIGTLTGYDPTGESINTHGFSLQYFETNWYIMLHQLHDTGLTFIFPIAVAGMIWMYWWNWRLALLMSSWIIPSVLVYSFYYWAPDGSTIGYLRFFLTILPALVLCAFWLLPRVAVVEPDSDPDVNDGRPHRGFHFTRPFGNFTVLVAGALTALAAAINLRGAVAAAELDQWQRVYLDLDVRQTLDAIHARGGVAAGNAVIFSRDQNLLNDLQFVTRDRVYNSALFTDAYVRNLSTEVDFNDPQGLDPNRRKDLAVKIGGFDQRRLTQEEDKIIADALDHGRSVYFVDRGGVPLRRSSAVAGLETRTVATWAHSVPPPEPDTAMAWKRRPNKGLFREKFSSDQRLQLLQVIRRPGGTVVPPPPPPRMTPDEKAQRRALKLGLPVPPATSAPVPKR